MEKHLDKLDVQGKDFVQRVNEVATELMVSSQALLWRLVDLGKLNRGTCKDFTETDWFSYNGGLLQNETPPLMSKKFLVLLACALQEGLISERRFASLLDLSFEELIDLYNQHGLDNPLGL